MPFISPFTTVLRTNYVPTPNELGAIERMLEGPNAELRALEDQLSHLQRQLETKTVIRENLSTNIAEHENLLSSCRCLPDDILSEIFMACLPTTHEATMDYNEPPLILGHICRRWRSIAYHTPRLWATLHIAIPTSLSFHGLVNTEVMNHFNQISEQKIQHHQIRISAWLSRSRTCPLSISIHEPFSSFSDSPARSYYDLLLNFSDRILRLDLTIPNQQLTSDILATIPPTSFSRLRVLSLNFRRRLMRRRRRVTAAMWTDIGLLNVPNLTCLSISGCPLRFEEMNVNWSHLTHIAMSDTIPWQLDISDAQKIFTRCPRLHFCAIEILSRTDRFITHIPLSLPYLHTLSIVDGSTGLDDLFQYADIPSLRNLTYHSRSYLTFDRRSPILAILSRTDTRVERLTTNIQSFTLVDLIECFEMIPSLTHLTNIHCGFEYPPQVPVAPKMLSALLELLTPADDRPVYLPNLQVINFDLRGWDICLSDRELLNFIQCRMDKASRELDTRVAALTEVCVVSMNEMEVDVRAHLAQYISNGMKLDLTYCGVDPSSSPFPHTWPDNRVRIFEVDEDNYL